jgi:hypothetical protein
MANIALAGSGKGHMKGAGQGGGKGPRYPGQYWQEPVYPDNWNCQKCGYSVWARKLNCPKCDMPKEQDARAPGATRIQRGESPGPTDPQGQEDQCKEEDGKDTASASKAIEAKRKAQIKAINKALADWPGGGKDSVAYASMRREEEALTAAIIADKPKDIQLLSAKEQVNLAKRMILKSEAKKEAAQVEANTGADELRAARTAHELAEARLDKMQATFKDLTVTPKEESGITAEEQELLKKVRVIRETFAGDFGSPDYQRAIADIIPKKSPARAAEEAPKPSAPTPGPITWAERTTLQGKTAGGVEAKSDRKSVWAGGATRPQEISISARGVTEDGPAPKKRGAELSPKGLKRKEEAERQGTAMQDGMGDPAQGPWPPLQEVIQEVEPMDLTGGEEFTKKEAEAWEKSKAEWAREKDLEVAAGRDPPAGGLEAPPEGASPEGEGAEKEEAAKKAAAGQGEDTGDGEEDASDAEEDEDADTELPDEERPTDPPENDT